MSGLVLLLSLLGIFEGAAQAESSHHRQTVVVNPVGLLVVAIGTSNAFTVVSANARYQRSYDKNWALAVAPQLGYADIFGFQHYMAGVKVGPRYGLSGRYLDGWYVSPLALVGVALSRQFGRHAQSAMIAGAGAEIGYAWHWSHVVLELGAGLHCTGLVAHSSRFDGESGEVPGFGVAPTLNLSLGYGW